jgi:hypothetical protein
VFLHEGLHLVIIPDLHHDPKQHQAALAVAAPSISDNDMATCEKHRSAGPAHRSCQLHSGTNREPATLLKARHSGSQSESWEITMGSTTAQEERE